MKPTPSGGPRGFLEAIATGALALGLLATSTTPASAASMSAGTAAPTIDGEDIASYGAVTGTDKWWVGTSGDSAAKGQTFVTGGAAVRLNSITYQVSATQMAEPTKTYAIRVGEVAGDTFTEVHSETATQSFTWNSGEYMTWTFDTPVLLEPYTTYGVDVGMLTSTSNWQSGIPYLNVTADDFAGGTRYTSGLSGVGTGTINVSLNSDRIFHLDIERPLGPVFELVSTSPGDDATDALASRELVLTFSQDVSPGTGNLVLRDLTDPMSPVETIIPAGDPALTYDQNVVRINPAGLLDWDKDYAVRIDAGAILGDGGAPIPAITDDTTWNFSTLAADPLLEAIAALKDHITGTTILTGPEIAGHKTTIDNLRQRLGESTAIIDAVFDLITTYDGAEGPLFVGGSTVTSFDRNNTNPADNRSVSPENIHWVVYTIMQHTMDVIYSASVLADPAKLDRLENYVSPGAGFVFGSHTDFPGPCPAPLDPLNIHNVQIDGSFPITFGRDTQQWTLPARKPTGAYLAPGTIATVTVPAALVDAGYKVRVGAHSWDLSGRRPVERLERATCLYPIDATSIKVASPYGGGVYIEVPIGAGAGVVGVSVTGAVRSPYFSAKSFHQTTPTEWDTERQHVAPWADFQSEKFMVQVPTKWIYNHPDPAQMMADWDAAMDAINGLMGFPTDRGKETMYCQPDVIMRSSVHAPGYPAVNVTTNPNSEVSPAGYAGNYLVRGPGNSVTASHIEFHEQGHAYFFPKFGGESESNVNLLQPAMLNRAFGVDFDTAHRASLGSGNTFRTLDNTAVAWMCVFNFAPREAPMASAEKAYQHKGHAKFLDIARLFGWQGLDDYWQSFMQDDADGTPYGTSDDDKLLRLSRHVGWDLRPLFHFWGVHPQDPEALAAAIAAESIPPSPLIRDQLLHYKTLIPADNAAFRTFATAWWNKQPSINGYWEEREHSRQWDQAALFGAGDQQRADITINEEYIPACATQIEERVDELVELYFPSAITPNPMSFAVAPTPADATTAGMIATTATAGVGPIEYLFEETSGNPGGDDSGWQTSPLYHDDGLTTGLTYTYTVTARDGLGNLTTPSAGVDVTPTASGDQTSPSPDPMSFAVMPYALDESSITMAATAATDVNAVEYYFECTSGNGTDSGWQSGTTFTDAELSPLTEYRYRVRARDSEGNTTGWSAEAITNTSDIPDVTPPAILTLAPANGGSVNDVTTNLVATFDEPIVAGSGFVTLKNLTDATESQIDITDATQVSITGSTLTIDPAAELLLNRNYAVRIESGAVADVSSNPFSGITDDSTWNFSILLDDPLADPGGPYSVRIGNILELDGSASLASGGGTITTYEWDLDNDGDFDEGIGGATPAAIDFATLTGTYGMVEGANTIRLRVTDSFAKTATESTTVNLLFTQGLTWDPASTGGSDGSGGWLDPGAWWDGSASADWNNTTPDSAIIGSGGTAGNLDLTGDVTVDEALFDQFTGKYQLSNGTLTVDGTLTWGPNTTASGNNEGVEFTNTASLAGDATSTIVVDGNYPVDKSRGQFNIRSADNTAFNGTWDVRNGVLFTENGRPNATSKIILNGGPGASQGAVYSSRWSQTLDRALGTGANQIQVLGNRSGFEGQGTNGLTVRLDGTGNQAVQWGSADFNPSALLLMSPNANSNSTTNFDTAIDLNGADRTVEVDKEHGRNIFDTGSENNWGRGQGVLNLAITNSSGTAAGLVKEGVGRLQLNGTNTYDGGTTVNAGQIYYTKAAAMPGTGTHTFNTGSELQVAIGGGDDFTIGAGTAPGSLGGLLAGTGPGTSTTTFNGDITVTLIGGGTVESDLPDVGGGGTNYWMVSANKTLSGNNTFTGTLRVGKRGGDARTVTLGSATALTGGGDVYVDTKGTGTLDLNGNDASIGQLFVGSNNGGQQGTVTGTGSTLTITGGIELDSHNDGGGRVSCDTLDLSGATQLFKHTGNNRATPDLIIDADVQNGGLITNATSGQSEIRLNGTNTYTGGTTHEAGRLVIDGSLADATMSITGGDVQGSGTLTFNISGATVDQVVTSGGNINIGSMSVTVLGTPTVAEYVLIDATGAGSYSGTFASSTLPAGYALDYGTPDIVKIVGTPGGSPFDTWAGTGTLGPVTFEGDTNGDGVQDGIAFLLGVANPDDDANGALPDVSEDGSGGLVLSFECLPSGDRGTAELRIEHSSDLGGGDPWQATTDQVPDATDAVPDNGVTFVVTPGSPTNAVVATIGASEAVGGKLFGRLTATE